MKFLSEKISKKDIISALKIYNFYISNSLANFEEKKLTIQDFLLLYKKIRINKLPFILLKNDDVVAGISFVNKFREKSGYRFAYEHSIYIKHNLIKKGYGSLIMEELLKKCKKSIKIKNLIAVIGGTNNTISIKFHKKHGFKYIGTLKKIGYKKNKWIDSIYMQKKL